ERNEVVGRWGVLAGGNYNLVSGDNGTVSGGGYNVASGEYSSVGGGLFNDARGFASRVGGGDANCAGADFSWAGGQGARARPATAAADGPCSSGTVAGGDVGSFVWSDAYAWPGAVFESTGPNQFLVQAAGGMALNTSVLPRHTTLLVKGRPGSDGNANLYLEHGARTVGFNLGVGAVGSTGAQLFIARFNRSSYVDLARFRSDGRFEVFVDNPVKPGGGSWAAASDARLKHHVEELDGATALQQ